MSKLIRSLALLVQNVPLDSLEKLGFTLVPEAREAYKMNSERAYMAIIALCGAFMALDVETQVLIGINTVLGLVCTIAGGGAVTRVISQKSITEKSVPDKDQQQNKE